MSDDLRALLAAVVAEPADDTVRLAYADCLQEHGNAPRAEFIRLQIDAERLHPDSNARARLEERAQALFAEHWTDWWGEVCAAVGFPMPVPKSSSALGRIARRVGLATPAGHPYETFFKIAIHQRRWKPIDGWVSATFRRGFPDAVSVEIPLRNYSVVRSTLARWQPVSPLASLTVSSPLVGAFLDGPHLAGVRTLRLFDFDPAVLRTSLGSPYFARLEELELESHESVGAEGIRFEFADQVAEAVSAMPTKRLKRLYLQVWTDSVARAVAGAAHLAGLTALEVSILPGLHDDDRAGASRRLATLARSPHLAGLRELAVYGGADAVGIGAVLRNPTWKHLRKLELDLRGWDGMPDLFAGADELPELEEVRFTGVRYDAWTLDALAHSPLLKRVRHFAVRGTYRGGPLPRSLARAVDPDRIETFAIDARDVPARVVEYLRAKFGDRFRPLA
jgi:uncharacterized protein (TIGR02996 family)